MLFKNLLKTIEKIEETISKEESGSKDISKEEYASLDYMDFIIAKSIIQDVGQTTSSQIAKHIFAHCENDIDY